MKGEVVGGVVTKAICGDEPQRFHPVTPLAAGREEFGRALKVSSEGGKKKSFLYASESVHPHLDFFSVTKFKQ